MNTTHITTTSLQKVLLAGGSAVMAIMKPQRGDMVATMGEATAFPSILLRLRQRMEAEPSGRQLLQIRPRITNESVDLSHLSSLPNGTLGREYSRFLANLNTSPNARPPVRFVDDPDLVFVMQRYRETHDLNHVLLGMPTTMLGEVTVKWFEALQFGFPMCILGGLFGAVRLGPKHRQRFKHSYLPWIIQQATKGRFLLAVDWESNWEMPLMELRSRFAIDPPPTD